MTTRAFLTLFVLLRNRFLQSSQFLHHANQNSLPQTFCLDKFYENTKIHFSIEENQTLVECTLIQL